MRITVLGSGGWGTALALLLTDNGHKVTLWSHSAQRCELLRRERVNPRLPGVALPEALELTDQAPGRPLPEEPSAPERRRRPPQNIYTVPE